MRLETIKTWAARTDKCDHKWVRYEGLVKISDEAGLNNDFKGLSYCPYCFSFCVRTANNLVLNFRSPYLQVEEDNNE